jgi:hypothetical protein
MPRSRICSVNGEWMNDWFTPDADPDVDWRSEFTRDGQTNDTEETASRLAAMIRAIDPDVLALEEGPSRAAELALFVRDHLATRTSFPRRQRRGAEAGPALQARVGRFRAVGAACRSRGSDPGMGCRRQRRRGARPLRLHPYPVGRRSGDRRAPAANDRRAHQVELHQPGPQPLGGPGHPPELHRRGAREPPAHLGRGHAHPPLPRPPAHRRARCGDRRARRSQRRAGPGLLRRALHHPLCRAVGYADPGEGFAADSGVRGDGSA